MRSVLTLLTAAAFAAGCTIRPPLRQDWVELQTAHFDIVSSLSAAKTQALARDIELFRASVEFLAGEALPAPLRMRVYAFDNRILIWTLNRTFNRRNVSAASVEPGYFLESAAGPAIVLRDGGGWKRDASVAMRHDYAHYLLRNRGGLDRPAWYDEGMAWMAATTEVSPPRAVLGRLPERQMLALREGSSIQIDEILDADAVGEWSWRRRKTFAAEAWALVHDLHFRDPLKAGGRLREILDAGPTELEEFRRSLGPDLEALNERLRLYQYHDRWEGTEIEATVDEEVGSPRPIDPADAMRHLGWLALRLDHPAVAWRSFRASLGRQPGDASALSGLGMAAARRRKWAEARKHMQAAEARAPDASVTCLAAARLDLEQARASKDPAERAQLAEGARRRLDACEKLGATRPEFWALYGETYLLDGEPSGAARDPLDRAQKMLPSSLEIQLLRARQKLREGRVGSAKTLAVNVLSRSHDAALRRAAKKILDTHPADPAADPSAASGGDAVVRAGPAGHRKQLRSGQSPPNPTQLIRIPPPPLNSPRSLLTE
jgi:tetratricopeptide (TPR) repeat protein